MNARKAIFILGSIALAFIAACVAVALFSHKKMETERNQAKTAPARAARIAKRETLSERESEITSMTPAPESIKPETLEEVKPQSENETV